MKTITKTAMIVLAAGACVLAASAQEEGGPPPGEGPHGHHRPPPLIAALDANHDGVIDASEIANASAALKTLDKNGDGQLTRDELMPPMPRHEGTNNAAEHHEFHGDGHRPPMSPVHAALDANHDGVIDASEIANASAALKTLDKNGDGQLTRDELMPHWEHGGPHGKDKGGDEGGPPPDQDK